MYSVIWKGRDKVILETGHSVSYQSDQRRMAVLGSRSYRSAVSLGLLFLVILTVYLISSGADMSGMARIHEIGVTDSASRKTKSQAHKDIEEDSDDRIPQSKGDKCKSHLIETLDNIFLAINFNHAFYENIPVLLKYYEPVFPNYAICGPVKSRKYKVIKVKYPKGETGYYSYRCLSLVIKRHPGHKGYLFLNDDMIVNWWNFLHLDKDQLWYGCYPDMGNGNLVDKAAPNRWWKRAKSAERCSAAFHAIEKSHHSKEMANYFSNTKGKKICLSCWSDIFYIPRKHTARFTWFADTFYKHFVFLEVAVPMTLFFLEDLKRQQMINGVYLPDVFGNAKDYLEGGVAWKVYNRGLTFIHPYKLTGLNNTENVNRFEEIVVAVSNEVLSKQCLDTVYVKNDGGDFRWDLDKS